MNASTGLHNITVAVARAPQQPFTIEPARIRGPQGDEVLVRVVATGLCHTDLIMRDQHYPVPLPAVLGHEGAGIVEQVGPTVKNLKAGDHVVLTYGACGHCNPCASGHKAYCKDFYPLNFGGSDAHGHTARCRHLRANRYTIISLPSPLFCHLRARARAQRHQGAH